MVTALMLPNLTKIWIYVDFKINQYFISKVLCINKKKPLSTCNGRCYLSGKLEKAEEHGENKAISSKKESIEGDYYVSKFFFNFICHNNIFTIKIDSNSVPDFFISYFIADIFRPPKFNSI